MSAQRRTDARGVFPPLVQGAIIYCDLEREKMGVLWSSIAIPDIHPVFWEPVAPIPNLLGIPIAAYRVGTRTKRRHLLWNERATSLMRDPQFGTAPDHWREEIGSVLVARKDGKPLLVQHLECLYEHISRIVTILMGGSRPYSMYHWRSFESTWNEFKSERADKEDWKNVRTPYEV
ncbi:hypothetical protein B0T21DRAFT_417181 [Apiosordaria backusii]|uniref:Uncharacterized protein n=1 Tax=Apiosordaria backusii TaxID=314023 RepID=A0AA39ZPL7_9PEZI|nr:hypothetical protein B0T21DRAFT_417181 [Apiosordaria backusii]